MTDLIEITCCTGNLPLYVKPGPGSVEIRDTNGAVILTLDLTQEGRYKVELAQGIIVHYRF